jgi:hypothetical protein
MRLIDRIVLNRSVKIFLDFILAILKIFEKHIPEDKPDGPVKPKPKRPLKDLVDNILPWRK